MFFLLRMAFWLSVVLVLLPSGTPQRDAPTSNIDASQAISAASATVGDLSGFCTRQPDACTVGSQVATVIGYKVQAGARMLYHFLTESSARHDAETAAAGKPGADKAAEAASQNTLTPADLTPVWRGPAARKASKPSTI
jgi:hypothetical protein